MSSDAALWWKSFTTYAFRVKTFEAEGQNQRGSIDAHRTTGSEGKRGSGIVGLSGRGENELRRTLSALDLTLMGVGGSIGAGIFVLTGVAARQAGPGVVISFALAAAACVLNALCYAEMASRFALSGSAYLYTILAFGELPALTVGLNLLVDYHVGAATISRSMAVYFVKMVDGWGLNLPRALGNYELNEAINISMLSPIFLLLFTLILIRGVQESKWTNLVLTSLKIFIVLLVVFGGAAKVDTENWNDFVPEGASSIFSATSAVFFSYIGFDVVANAAEEASKPSRDVPIGVVLSLVICAVLYCLVSLILTGIVPYEDISKSAPLSDALSKAGVQWGQQAINIGATIGLGTTLLTGMYAQSRLYLSIARDGLLPEILQRVSGSLRVPVYAQIWCGILAAILATFFDVEALARILSIGIMLAYSVVCWSMLSFRSNHNRRTLGLVGIYAALVLGMSVSLSLSSLLPWYLPVLLATAALLTWIPIFRERFDSASPRGTYRCPLVPGIPLLGLGANIFMATQLHWAAWLRLGVVCLVVFALYLWRAWGLRNTMEPQEDGDRAHMYERLNLPVADAEGKAIPVTPSIMISHDPRQLGLDKDSVETYGVARSEGSIGGSPEVARPGSGYGVNVL
eukprot:CAMPEP_0184489814 /NCGR_PEP_ID=MMETSP0113_2-20130426/16430_1 /TAXON_ID=91329 /ORGANISM="Norrisiella sphaerica, Strain BC52" /LENGTH=629 /DNA_ID=CAMNT_0026873443 /DNA_START=170 /DNA_END=2059 /DNA_ORIENTATION=-